MNEKFRNDKAKNGIFVVTVIVLITFVTIFLMGYVVGRTGRYGSSARSASRSRASGGHYERYDRGRWIDARGE